MNFSKNEPYVSSENAHPVGAGALDSPFAQRLVGAGASGTRVRRPATSEKHPFNREA